MTVRTTFDRYDCLGTRGEVVGSGNAITIFLYRPRNPRARYQLDADAAVRLARDLLERVACDDPEVIAARAALRLLADRNEPGYYDPAEPPPCDEFDWRSLA
jgi:hypothetical protein